MPQIIIPQIFRTQAADIALAILLKLGGTMQDVEEIYRSQTDDILYAILKRLTTGGGGLNRLQIREADAIGTLYPLPEKSLITHVIVKSDTNKTFSIITDITGSPDIIIVDTLSYIAGKVETFAPIVYIPFATNVFLPPETDRQTSVDIFYINTTI